MLKCLGLIFGFHSILTFYSSLREASEGVFGIWISCNAQFIVQLNSDPSLLPETIEKVEGLPPGAIWFNVARTWLRLVTVFSSTRFTATPRSEPGFLIRWLGIGTGRGGVL